MRCVHEHRRPVAIHQAGLWGLMAVAAVCMAPVPGVAQSGGNPWNPNSRASVSVAPTNPAPKYVARDTVVQPPAALQQDPMRSRFAPDGLEQQLESSPYIGGGSPEPDVTPEQPTYAPPQTAGTGIPVVPDYGYGAVPQTYGTPAYPQGYGAYPQGYGGVPNWGGYPGYGSYGSPIPFGFPGGTGSFPGNFSNGGVPGFNFSPFGFF